MKWLLVAVVVLLQAGCAQRTLRCDGTLRPINTGTAAAQHASAHPIRPTP